MNICESLKFGIKKLSDFDRPDFEAEILLAHVLKRPRVFLLTYPETKLTAAQSKTFNELIKKRRAGWPSAYLTSHQGFYGLDFKVTPAVLVPRPETELLVEMMLGDSQEADGLADIGTGSGCIISSLSANVSLPAWAIDYSPDALKIARFNIKKHNLTKRVKLLRGNLLEPLLPALDILRKKQNLTDAPLILVAANLPYLTPAQIKSSPSIKREPRLALVAGKDGMLYYREMFKQLNTFLKQSKQTWRFNFYCEIDPSQTRFFTKKNLGLPPDYLAEISIKKDLRKKYRFVIIKIKPLE
jgi:release factor glutamine methyltransferase